MSAPFAVAESADPTVALFRTAADQMDAAAAAGLPIADRSELQQLAALLREGESLAEHLSATRPPADRSALTPDMVAALEWAHNDWLTGMSHLVDLHERGIEAAALRDAGSAAAGAETVRRALRQAGHIQVAARLDASAAPVLARLRTAVAAVGLQHALSRFAPPDGPRDTLPPILFLPPTFRRLALHMLRDPRTSSDHVLIVADGMREAADAAVLYGLSRTAGALRDLADELQRCAPEYAR